MRLSGRLVRFDFLNPPLCPSASAAVRGVPVPRRGPDGLINSRQQIEALAGMRLGQLNRSIRFPWGIFARMLLLKSLGCRQTAADKESLRIQRQAPRNE